jgi:hypothetical protein
LQPADEVPLQHEEDQRIGTQAMNDEATTSAQDTFQMLWPRMIAWS